MTALAGWDRRSGRVALVTGADGQLGRELVSAFAAAGWKVRGTDRGDLDVTDRDAVLGAVTTLRPDAVVNAAAWTAVDDCEADPDRAWRINALAVRHLAEACDRNDAHLCQISTDYVFSGDKEGPYVEWDEPGPRSAYGRSKLAGEREAGERSTVVRTSWLCGAHGANVARTVLSLASDPERELAFVDDQRGCPTMAADLAPAVVALVADRRRGIHHVTNSGAVTWYELAREVLDLAGHDPDRVRPIATADLSPPRPAPRPANSVLDNAALRLAGLLPLRHHVDALAELIPQLTGRSIHE
jgi:dTDP-4-dehydrorhamnose reductase